MQLAILRKVPCVAQALEEGRLELHGWVYRFEAGEVEELDPVEDRFVSLNTGTPAIND